MKSSGYPQGHALVVAVATYHHINSLPDIVLNDAHGIIDVLSSPQYCGYPTGNIEQLINNAATKERVLAGLKNLAVKTGPEDTVCVFFSGHGARAGGLALEESYLLTVDCRGDDLAGTSISASEFTDALHAIKAKRLIVFLDACHAAGAGVLKGQALSPELTFGFDEKSLTQLAEGTGRALLASSRPTEVSLIMHGASNSVFTEAVLQGLRGAADQHNEGVIKVFDLFEYVAERVVQTTQDRQHPIFKATALERNFPIALSAGNSNKAPQVASSRLAMPSEIWAKLCSTLASLYPGGPNDQDVWERAGGEVSRLRLQGTGNSIWFGAMKVLQQGGGGVNIDVHKLITTALEDFPGNQDLLKARTLHFREKFRNTL